MIKKKYLYFKWWNIIIIVNIYIAFGIVICYSIKARSNLIKWKSLNNLILWLQKWQRFVRGDWWGHDANTFYQVCCLPNDTLCLMSPMNPFKWLCASCFIIIHFNLIFSRPVSRNCNFFFFINLFNSLLY